MICRFSSQAIADLEAIGDYIAKDDPRRAKAFSLELRRKCLTIGATPRAYRLRPDVEDGVRLVTHGNYLVCYSLHDDHVMIDRFIHARRDLRELF